MFNFNSAAILSFSIIFAAILSVVRYNKALQTYRPFFFFIWLALLSEIINVISIEFFHVTAVSANIYTLFEFALIIWLVARWNKIYSKPEFFYMLFISGLLVWILDNVILYNLKTENSIFRIFYSLIIVYLSIKELNQLLFSNEKKFLYNSKFIICIAFLVYFTYKATFEVFFMVPVGWSNNFYNKLFTIFIIVNLFSNILYALAVLCIPKRQKFILPY